MSLKTNCHYPRINVGHVAACAGSAFYYWKNGDVVTTTILAILGNLGAELHRRIGKEMLDIQIKKSEMDDEKRWNDTAYSIEKFDYEFDLKHYNISDFVPEQFLNRIKQKIDYRPREDDEIIKTALERIKNDFPIEYYDEVRANIAASFDFANGRYTLSVKEYPSFIKEKLDQGCCYGVQNAIFETILNGSAASMAEGFNLIKSEDIYYHQLLQDLYVEPDLIDTKCSPLHNLEFHFENKKPNFDDKELYSRRQYVEKCNENIKHRSHSQNFCNSEKFFIQETVSTYENHFQQLIRTFPEENDFVGVIHLPKHVIGFQFGPRGYFLCDSFSTRKGLFQYWDSDTFFSELRKHGIYDRQRFYKDVISRKKPKATSAEIFEDVKVEMEKTQVYLSIRPLRQINPFISPLQESWTDSINRKIDSYIHTIALFRLGTTDSSFERITD